MAWNILISNPNRLFERLAEVNTMRNQRGSITAFSAGLAFVLIVLGMGFFFFIMYMNAQKETKNAVDAGMLNVGKKSLDEITVQLGPKEVQLFEDVATDDVTGKTDLNLTNRKANLRRINRIWAKALMVAINAEDAKKAGQAGDSDSNAQNCFDAASSISDRLADKLTSQTNLHGFFKELAQQNSVRMIGNGAKVNVIPGAGWQTSRMEAEKESNIVLAGSQNNNFMMPPKFGMSPNFVTKGTRKYIPSEATNYYFLKGYEPLNVGGNTFWQVPFLYDEKPHLVAGSLFNDAQQDAPSWQKAVPNAFSGEGAAEKAGRPGERAKSWVLTNPRQPFKLCIPHSFVKFKVDDPKVTWYFFPPPVGGPPVPLGTSEYEFIPDTKTRVGTGILCSTVTAQDVLIGIDVAGCSINDLIFESPAGKITGASVGGDEKEMESYLVNRANEMISKPGVTITASQVHSTLNGVATTAGLIAGEREFIMFSPDGKSLECLPTKIAAIRAPWLLAYQSKEADGTEKEMFDQDTPAAEMFHIPNVIPAPFCNLKTALGWGFHYKDVFWKPGSGANGSLGEVRIKRYSKSYSLGVCTPII